MERFELHRKNNNNKKISLDPSARTCIISYFCKSKRGNRDGADVRTLAFQQCGPCSIPGPGVICGLFFIGSLLAPRGFSPGTPVLPLVKDFIRRAVWYKVRSSYIDALLDSIGSYL